MAPKTGDSLSCHPFSSVPLLWSSVNAVRRGFCVRVNGTIVPWTMACVVVAMTIRRWAVSVSTHCVNDVLRDAQSVRLKLRTSGEPDV